jgi:hypothetical protein
MSRMVPSLALWGLLDVCARHNVEAPVGTGHITCDGLCCNHIASTVLSVGDELLEFSVVKDAFYCDPVKQAWAICRSILQKGPEDIMERDLRLRRRAAKREEREAS